jgi:hypothetical protein
MRGSDKRIDVLKRVYLSYYNSYACDLCGPPVHAPVPAAPLTMDEFDLDANLKSDQHF